MGTHPIFESDFDCLTDKCIDTMAPKTKKDQHDQAASPINENLWPEWSDSDINSEKWEAGARKGDKGKPATPTFFEDPEGRSFLPESLAGACAEWRRIPDIYA